MFEWVIILFLGTGLLYGLQSRRLQRRNISSPMMMVITGALIALPLGIWHEAPLAPFADRIHFATGFSEMTLAIILFLDSAVLDYRKEKPAIRLANRLLLIGLPLTPFHRDSSGTDPCPDCKPDRCGPWPTGIGKQIGSRSDQTGDQYRKRSE
jgi:NhaP-type Na+/H+ or K+/H+ antiporter